MSALIANPPPIPNRPLRTGPNVRTPEQIATARDHAGRAVERFSDLEHAVATCLRHATETLGYRCTVSDAAAYDIRRSMSRFLATLHLDPPPHMPLSVINHALEWTGGDDDPANETVGSRQQAAGSGPLAPQEDQPDASKSHAFLDPAIPLAESLAGHQDACPAEAAAASSLQSLPDIIVASVNDERDEILTALGLELVTVLPSTAHGRFKLVVRSQAEGSPPIGPIPMLYPEVVTVDDVRDKIVCGEIPLRLAMPARLILNVEHGPPGDPPHLAAYRVHRAATNGGVN